MNPAILALRCSLTLTIALASLGVAACNSSPQGGAPAPSASAGIPRALPAPAGAEILALLDGLAVGDKVGGVPVVAIGAIDARGTIPVVIEQGGAISVVVIAARTETPAPPVSTKSYSVFFEGFDGRNPLSQQQVLEAAKDIAARLRKTEDKLPVPPALKPLARPGVPT